MCGAGPFPCSEIDLCVSGLFPYSLDRHVCGRAVSIQLDLCVAGLFPYSEIDLCVVGPFPYS